MPSQVVKYPLQWFQEEYQENTTEPTMKFMNHFPWRLCAERAARTLSGIFTHYAQAQACMQKSRNAFPNLSLPFVSSLLNSQKKMKSKQLGITNFGKV